MRNSAKCLLATAGLCLVRLAGLNGNHNGGPILFGPDAKLYVYLGDQGRRGWMQNLANGPFPFVDDTHGGPAPPTTLTSPGAFARASRELIDRRRLSRRSAARREGGLSFRVAGPGGVSVGFRTIRA